MLQTWFSDILVTNEDERCNQLRIRNYELPTHQASQNPENPEILKILIQTIIHQASQNQGNQDNHTNHSSDKIMVQTKPCYKHGSRTSSLQTRMRVLNSQFSVLNSQFSILSSQFSVLNSQFSIKVQTVYKKSRLKD